MDASNSVMDTDMDAVRAYMCRVREVVRDQQHAFLGLFHVHTTGHEQAKFKRILAKNGAMFWVKVRDCCMLHDESRFTG